MISYGNITAMALGAQHFYHCDAKDAMLISTISEATGEVVMRWVRESRSNHWLDSTCLALAAARSVARMDREVRARQWRQIEGVQLRGKTLAVIGLGKIGREVARRARAFGMEVHGFGNYWPEEIAAEFQITRHASLDSLFDNVDIISPHTNLNAQTLHCINAERLNRLPDGSWVINTGRGELIDQAAIIAALDSGKLAGYAADVLDQEPPPADHPLLHHPKVIITPHVGSRTFESVPRQAMKSLTNLINALKGEGECNCANGVI